jgi:hypothetical protein
VVTPNSFAICLRIGTALLVALVAGQMVGCAESPPEQSPAAHAASTDFYFGVPPGSSLDDYFQAECRTPGNLGIGFLASHTYLYTFQQRLGTTKDRELERLYVLYHLYGDVEEVIQDLENGKIRVTTHERRPISAEEAKETAKDLEGRIIDLSRFDPGDPEKEISRDRERLQRIKITETQ